MHSKLSILRNKHWIACVAAALLTACSGGTAGTATTSQPDGSTASEAAVSGIIAHAGGTATMQSSPAETTSQSAAAAPPATTNSTLAAPPSAAGAATPSAPPASTPPPPTANSTPPTSKSTPTPPASTGTPGTAAGTSPTPLVISGTPAATVVVGAAYLYVPTVSTAAGTSFSIANKPAWATFITATGQLAGAPTAANIGTFANIMISAQNGARNASLPAFAIQVKAAPSSAPTVESIALSPLTLHLGPQATQQLTITAAYSNAGTQVVPPADATFRSSNTSVATVSGAGVVTIAADAAAGATATISATDTAAGIATAGAASTVVTVAAAGGAPTPNSATAAKATAQNNTLCGAPVTPYYWEIGDQNGTLISGSRGTDSSGAAVVATSTLSIASASKMIYASYVTQVRGGASKLTAQDINFLHFTSGYTNMDEAGTACPNTDDPDTVNQCLKLSNSLGVLYSAQNPATVGTFDYNGGHMENHASLIMGMGNIPVNTLGSTMQGLLGTGVAIRYTEPLMSGGILGTAQQYAAVLQHILNGSLHMHDALGTSPVCTRPSSTCNATYSPIRESWHYSIGHWVEDDPATNGDGAFSSPGAFGFYPWIDSSKAYYGVISRSAPQGNGEQQGYASVQCGRLIRHAWMTGVEQTQSIPSD